MKYDGEIEIVIEIVVGGRLINWTLPITISNLYLFGRVNNLSESETYYLVGTMEFLDDLEISFHLSN